MIDFHTHCFPDKIAERAMDAVSNHGTIPHYSDGTVKDLIENMSRAGIDKAVVLNIATNPKQQENVNNFAREINGEKLIAFGSVNPFAENALDEIERIKQMGLRGVKFHPEYQEFDVEDTKYYPIYEACYENDLIMSFHAGKDIAFPNTNMAHPAALRKIYNHLPNAKIVFAHLGGWLQWAQVAPNLVGCSCYLDTSMTVGYLDPDRAADIIINHGVGKVLFGTDSPWSDLQESIDFIDNLALSSRNKDQIFHENAAQLLGL